jgi:hypothetical protein
MKICMLEGYRMDERRKQKRLPITMRLEILNLYKQDHELISDIHAPIEVVNISLTGIGFRSKSILPVGYYFNTSFNLGTEDTLHSVIRIIRSQPDDGTTYYGCEFVGVASVLSYILEDYDRRLTEMQRSEAG